MNCANVSNSITRVFVCDGPSCGWSVVDPWKWCSHIIHSQAMLFTGSCLINRPKISAHTNNQIATALEISNNKKKKRKFNIIIIFSFRLYSYRLYGLRLFCFIFQLHTRVSCFTRCANGEWRMITCRFVCVCSANAISQ